MTINATTCIQMFNFCVAWFFVRKLLIKPALAVREVQLKHYAHVHHSITSMEQQLVEIKNKQYQIWYRWHLQATRLTPELRHTEYKQPSIVTHTSTIPMPELDTIVDSMCKKIVQLLEDIS
jgi:hypothetical protein